MDIGLFVLTLLPTLCFSKETISILIALTARVYTWLKSNHYRICVKSMKKDLKSLPTFFAFIFDFSTLLLVLLD